MILTLPALLLLAGCHDDLDEFDRAALVPRTGEETEALRRLLASVARAEALLEGSALPERARAELSERIEAAKRALIEYDELRVQGSERSIVLAGIRTSSIAIVADDATVIGSADDLLLIPLAL
ncbi:hypothetical protein, partial [Haliangium sp.]|uniref:hypothetical protein n=1 Tax=Haliangium sp. TaxID=2663208 RepID=UPI003D0CE9BF